MSDNPSSEKKRTLTVKQSVKDDSSEKPAARKRIGARARNASLIEINREKQKRVSQTGAGAGAETSDDRAASSASGTRHSATSESSRPTSPKPSSSRSSSSRSPRSPSHDPRKRSESRGNPPRHAVTKATGSRSPTVQATPHQEESSSQTAPVNTVSRSASTSVRTAETFKAFAPCPVGLEQALEAELSALGFDGVTSTRAGVHFEVDWWGVQRANLYSRLATRILVRVAHGTVLKEDDIYDLARTVDWERWFGAEQSLRVDTSAVKSPFKSLQFCNLRAKDGICDHLRDLEGERPSIDTVRPDARVHLFLGSDTGTLYLDTSGESLFKRGWRLDKGEAPLRENLAAGLLALSGWDPEAPLMDPFCGSGTILIEAAWIALGVPPGIQRPFGFERLRHHQANRWQDLKEEARSLIKPELEIPLVGIDADPMAIEAAMRNMERAWLTEDTIQFDVGDARHAVAPAPTGWMLTNPPYGERLEEGETEFWREWSACLKKEFAGWQVNVITSDLELPSRMRLKPKRRIPIFNGALDCRLFCFDLVERSYRDA